MNTANSFPRCATAAALFAIGLAVFLVGVHLETRNPRTNYEDNVAWCVLAAGVALIAVGISLPFAPSYVAIIIGGISPFVAFALAVVAYWVWQAGYGNYRTRFRQEFAKNGISQIQPAGQMDLLFDDCRHFITYSGRGSVSIWNSVAYFGGRYQLMMQVPVAIESGARGEMISEPEFYLHEVSKVTVNTSGQVAARFSNHLEFSRAEWQAVFEADGDFHAIGFEMNSAAPIDGFETYAKASR